MSRVVLSLKSLVISGVRDELCNRKSQTSLRFRCAKVQLEGYNKRGSVGQRSCRNLALHASTLRNSRICFLYISGLVSAF